MAAQLRIRQQISAVDDLLPENDVIGIGDDQTDPDPRQGIGRLVHGNPLDDAEVSREEIRHGTLTDILDAHRRQDRASPLFISGPMRFSRTGTPRSHGDDPRQRLGPDLRKEIEINRSRNNHDKNQQGNQLQERPAPSPVALSPLSGASSSSFPRLSFSFRDWRLGTAESFFPEILLQFPVQILLQYSE